VIACGRVVKTGDREKRKGPEYETVVGFGPNLLNDNLEAIIDLGSFAIAMEWTRSAVQIRLVWLFICLKKVSLLKKIQMALF